MYLENLANQARTIDQELPEYFSLKCLIYYIKIFLYHMDHLIQSQIKGHDLNSKYRKVASSKHMQAFSKSL